MKILMISFVCVIPHQGMESISQFSHDVQTSQSFQHCVWINCGLRQWLALPVSIQLAGSERSSRKLSLSGCQFLNLAQTTLSTCDSFKLQNKPHFYTGPTTLVQSTVTPVFNGYSWRHKVTVVIPSVFISSKYCSVCQRFITISYGGI